MTAHRTEERIEAENIAAEDRAAAERKRDARDTAFEKTVSAAGKVLDAELASAGSDKTARRAAWARYGDVQDAAGTAYRAAQKEAAR